LLDTSFYETAHRKFGRGTPALRPAHSVGERGDGADTRLPQPLPHVTRCEIFVLWPATSVRATAHTNMQAHIWCSLGFE
jgi:hypothetical protein